LKPGTSLFIASRYLLGRGREGGRYLRGAAAGIALSLVPLVVTLIVADGMIRGITDRYLELGTGHLEIYDFSAEADVLRLRDTVAAFPGVTGAWPERQGLGLLVGPRGKSGATVRAVEADFLRDPGTRRYLKVLSGSAALDDAQSALLGEELARTIGAGVGDTVRLMTLRTGADGRSIPRLSPFVVAGIVSSGYRDLDALWFLISYQAGLRSLPRETSRTFLSVKIDDPYSGAADYAAALARELGDQRQVYTWKELQVSQYRSFEATRQLLLFIMALIVAVAAVNVASATSMLAVERRKDIAVLKSFGADPGGTTGVFMLAALLTGLAGSIVGIALGLGIGYTVNEIIHGLEQALGAVSRLFNGGTVTLLDPEYYLESIPVVVDWAAVAGIGVLTVLGSLLAAWPPARRAGKLQPTEILRKY